MEKVKKSRKNIAMNAIKNEEKKRKELREINFL